MAGKKKIHFDGKTVELSNLGKIFFPDALLTKGDMVEYYRKVADTMVRHTAGRPVAMNRFPDGIDGKHFFHKDVPDYFPDWIETKRIEKESGILHQLVCNDAATLVYIANQGCITPHIWLSRVNKLHHPDKLVFDLDPPENGDFTPVRKAASVLRDTLKGELGLKSYVMTTGSKGIHVVVPLDASLEFDEVRKFARRVAKLISSRNPDEYTIETLRKKRKGRIFLDYLRNSYAQTSVAPYSVRARPGAPVATPLSWDEISRSSLTARTYTIENIFRRLGNKEDPWKDFFKNRQSIKSARNKLDDLIKKEDRDSD